MPNAPAILQETMSAANEAEKKLRVLVRRVIEQV
jgi:hypothetical protein